MSAQWPAAAWADITKWIAYFMEGMAISFDNVRGQAQREAGKAGKDQSKLLRVLDGKQHMALTLFQKSRVITARDVAGLFGYQPPSAALLCQVGSRRVSSKQPTPAKKRGVTNWAKRMTPSSTKSTDAAMINDFANT
jgi:hypothetical protein